MALSPNLISLTSKALTQKVTKVISFTMEDAVMAHTSLVESFVW